MALFEEIITCVKNDNLQASNTFIYIDYIVEKKINSKVKSEIRDLSIGNIFGSIQNDEFISKKEMMLKDLESYESDSPTTLKAISQVVKSTKYQNLSDLDDIVLKYLVSVSNIPHPIRNTDINTSNIGPSSLAKLTLSTMIRSANLIAYSGRRGPGNIVLVGSDIVPILHGLDGLTSSGPSSSNRIGTVAGFDVFYNKYLNPNRVVVLRKEKSVESGVNLVWGDNNLYCLFNTDEFWKQMCWFDLI